MDGGISFPISYVSVIAVTIASQIFASYIVDRLSYEQLNGWRNRLKPIDWERDGAVYQRWFRIKAWKQLIPDAGATSPYRFRKKYLKSTDDEYLQQFVLESVRAELTHELTLLFAIPIILVAPIKIAKWLILYSLIMNIPCAMIQRYNRPRFERILDGTTKEDGAAGESASISAQELERHAQAAAQEAYQEKPKHRLFR